MKGWKLTAIVFIILFVLSWATFISVMIIGVNIVENEDKCSMEICAGEDYDAYFYESSTKLCKCFLDGEIQMAQEME